MPNYAYEDVDRAERHIERAGLELRRLNLISKKEMEASSLRLLVESLVYDSCSGEMGKSLDDIQRKVDDLVDLCLAMAETEILLKDLGDG